MGPRGTGKTMVPFAFSNHSNALIAGQKSVGRNAKGAHQGR